MIGIICSGIPFSSEEAAAEYIGEKYKQHKPPAVTIARIECKLNGKKVVYESRNQTLCASLEAVEKIKMLLEERNVPVKSSMITN